MRDIGPITLTALETGPRVGDEVDIELEGGEKLRAVVMKASREPAEPVDGVPMDDVSVELRLLEEQRCETD